MGYLTAFLAPIFQLKYGLKASAGAREAARKEGKKELSRKKMKVNNIQ